MWSIPPEFRLTVKTGAARSPFAAASPAGIFLAKNASLFDGLSVEWSDPYSTPIGVGSSSAQFLLTVEAVQALKNEPMLETQQILNLYWECVGSTQGLRPSGLDVAAQNLGGVHLVQNSPFKKNQLPDWKHESASFLLVFTGSKAKTHEHLQALQANGFPGSFKGSLRSLNEVTSATADSWKSRDAKELARALDEYQRVLTKDGFSTGSFSDLVASTRKIDGVLAAKGCGAQGGDSLLLLAERDQLAAVEASLRKLRLEPFRLEKSAPASRG